MGYEDEDFMMRQIKQMGEVLGGILGKKDAEEILSFENETKSEEQENQRLTLRETTENDLLAINQIVKEATAYLKEQGSPQWQDGHEPHENVIREDMQKKASYVLTLKDEVVGTVALIAEKDPVYEAIDGHWQGDGDGPYVALHHVAVSQKHRGIGLGKSIILAAINQAQELGFEDIRIDTYPANQPMLAVIEKLGFTYCGMIYFPFEHGERKAFQLIKRIS